MEAHLTTASLAEWEPLKDAELLQRMSKAAAAAGTQAKFAYDSAFKRELSEAMCRRWPMASSALRREFLIVIRCLCREKACIDVLLSRALVENIIASSGLTPVADADLADDERIEAVKCMVNAFFHHQRSIPLFLELSCLPGLARAACTERDAERRYLLLHLVFIVSAFQRPAQEEWRTDAALVHALWEEALKWEKLEKNASEALKVLFNLFSHCAAAAQRGIVEECLSAGRRILLEVPTGHSHVQNTVNVLGCLPIIEDALFPPLEKDEARPYSFAGRDMAVAQVVMDDLAAKLDKTEGIDMLGTYFNLLISAATESKAVRRYCRMKIIPPLTASDVERPPETGNTMRNKIIRVMQSPCQPRDLAAQFMYVLCKRSVNRLIKYTGLGHSAGLLANSGLLGRINEARRASDSEDSETEDYREVEERVNPVTGYVRPERPDPMAGMSDEQKEYEAMKLVQAMDKLLGEGIIKPASIGPDGRPTTVSHVLELVKDVKTPHGSDSDSD